MCGIAGIIAKASDWNKAALKSMSDAMSHRGPDGEGFWYGKPDAAGFACMMAHRRLSILDLSTAASQPMVDDQTQQAIVFNGEIYNYQELRAQLQGRGQSFKSTGDTAVMLRLLAIDGFRAVEKLRGMFAFGMWDERNRSLVLGRDPLGIKPLYIAMSKDVGGSDEWSLIFASEVRALLASGLIPHPKLNPAAVESVVWNGFVTAPNTIVKGITTLWPGEVRVYDDRGTEQAAHTYWQIPQPDSEQPISEDELADSLEESVRMHLHSDVPLGLFLSGGVDSSAVANVAKKVSSTEINTFTLTFEEKQFDEGAAARAISKAIGTTHHEILLTENDFVGNLEAAYSSLDQPSFDGINSYYISRAVRNAGLVVALVGTGGDELFGGYTSFRDVPRVHRLANQTSWVPGAVKQAGARAVRAVKGEKGAPGVGAHTRWAKLPAMVAANGDLLGLYQLSYGLFLPEFQDRLLASRSGSVNWGLPKSLEKRLRNEIHGHSALVSVSALEQRVFLGERLLRDADAASMAVSIETRLPLVDHVLLERVYRLNEQARYQPLGRKQMLRNIGLRGLDPALFERPKSGFVLPFERWIQQGLGRTMDCTMRDACAVKSVGLDPTTVGLLWGAFQQKQPGLYWSRIWSIYMLIRWAEKHGVTV